MTVDRPHHHEQTAATGFNTVADHISSIVLEHPYPRGWLVGFIISFAGVLLLFISLGYLLAKGVGIWGIQIPVAWGFAIVNLVWWIGIGHAGTLISAILLLLKQDWRTSINRFAEAMTLFAVACAVVFPLFHMGRPWFFYWMLPYPSTTELWPQFRSPLVWDVFAIFTYGTVSLLFWYVGLIPDLAMLRDKAATRLRRVTYGFLAMGWRGSAIHWKRFQQAYLLLAGLATPLVISVHSVVSFDFAVGIVPGWHSTIFPPFFVAGAIFSGFAMVLTIAIPLRSAYGLQSYITTRHIDNMGKVLLATGLMVSYGYIVETFIAWYSGNVFEQYMILNRMFGGYGIWYWLLIICNSATIQLLWFQQVRRNSLVMFVVALVINVGMWLERFIIVVQSLHREYVPSQWAFYRPTFWDWSTFIGTLGLFFTMLFLFIRFLPVISVFEMQHESSQHKEASSAS